MDLALLFHLCVTAVTILILHAIGQLASCGSRVSWTLTVVTDSQPEDRSVEHLKAPAMRVNKSRIALTLNNILDQAEVLDCFGSRIDNLLSATRM